MYQVITENNDYSTTLARDAADVAVTWKNNGLEPKLWVVAEVNERIVTLEVIITSKRKTAKALSDAASAQLN